MIVPLVLGLLGLVALVASNKKSGGRVLRGLELAPQ
jgi:hypothetical protein